MATQPDLNPMDFGIWSLLQERACKKPHKSLKRALQREWKKLDIDILQKNCDEFFRRLKRCIKEKTRYFE